MVPEAFLGTHYLDFLPALVSRRGVGRYLEIGVNRGDLLSRVSAVKAIGVDPNFVLTQNVAAGKRDLLLVQETSDDFFSNITRMQTFFGGPADLTFLDGLHIVEFLLRDFYNAEAASGADGLIVMHDCLALDGNMIHRDQATANVLTAAAGRHAGWWTGDIWKIIPILKHYRPDLNLTFLDSHPTGLVCVSHLDPSSQVLREHYAEIVEEAASVSNDEISLSAMYQTIDVLPPESCVL